MISDHKDWSTQDWDYVFFLMNRDSFRFIRWIHFAIQGWQNQSSSSFYRTLSWDSWDVRRSPSQSMTITMEDLSWSGKQFLSIENHSFSEWKEHWMLNGILNAERYKSTILSVEAFPFVFNPPNQSYNNARCYSAASTMQFLEDAGVVVLSWPARSPDLSPIVHV